MLDAVRATAGFRGSLHLLFEHLDGQAAPAYLELPLHSKEANERISGDIDDRFILSRAGFGKFGIGG